MMSSWGGQLSSTFGGGEEEVGGGKVKVVRGGQDGRVDR